MCKCEWLKKLLGLKKECCCHTKKSAPVNSEAVVESAPEVGSEPLKQASE
ncbi:hypothetical protein K9M09_00015 [Patescibacteria group bacterium]|nr:hypothetical protein [Patescibacteria group bacterium]